MSQTQIFARVAEAGRQILVYSMNFAAAEELAMILPLPVPVGAGDDAVRFIDLSGYPKFFKDVRRAFPEVTAGAVRGLAPAAASMRPKLVVHKVGSFEASFVPSRGDFDRLDARFKLSQDVWAKLPLYHDYGFAVFKLAPERGLLGKLKSQTIHPMAFSFPRRDPATLFFPTVHVHDGEVHETATFDHTLFCQPDELVAETFGWMKSADVLGRFVKPERAGGTIDGDRHVYKAERRGALRNEDVTITPPKLSGTAALDGSGTYFRFRVRVNSAYSAHPSEPYATWHRTASTQGDAISALLKRRLDELTAEHREAWRLRSYDEDLREHYCNNGELFMWGPMGPEPPPPGPGRARFDISNDVVEPQWVWLCFDEVPEPDACQAIVSALESILDELPAVDAAMPA